MKTAPYSAGWLMVVGVGLLGAGRLGIAQQAAGAPAGGAVQTSADSSAAGSVEAMATTPGDGARTNDSHVRIVRLSDVRGSGAGENVKLDRGVGRGFEATVQNMPIVEGSKLATNSGYAEVEFEDDSTLRVTPNTLVEFPLLVLRNEGETASTLKLVQGTMYVNLMASSKSKRPTEFVVKTGSASVTVTPGSHLRIETVGAGDAAKLTVSVFNGSAEVETAAGPKLVEKKQTLTMGGSDVEVAKNVERQPFDAWDKDENDYHQRYSKGSAFAASPYSYGVSDLNYYGAFSDFGCGAMWQPYLVGAGWSPYGSGMWAMYPGGAYSWVSPYPWGWLPFHSGMWSQCGAGWGWTPGGSWMGLTNTIAGRVPRTGPIQPPRPITGRPAPSLVVVNRAGMTVSDARGGSFVFRRDSAGLGVPRGSVGSLAKVSREAGQYGFVTRPAYFEGAGAGERAGGPVTLRTGSPHAVDGRSYGPSGVSNAGSGGNFSRGGGSSAPAPSAPSGASGGGSHGGGGTSGGGGSHK